jgi:RND family efflux transporter MFP subunit
MGRGVVRVAFRRIFAFLRISTSNPSGISAGERISIARVASSFLGVAAIAVLLTWTATRAGRTSPPIVSASQPHSVRAALVTTIEEVHELRMPGTARAVRRASLSFVVGGRLIERAVDVGSSVEQGAVLARLDPGPFENGVRSAKAALAEVRARLEQIERDRRRLTRLHAQGAASRRRLEEVAASEDEARASLDLARSRLLEARRQLGEATLVAPFDSTVTRVHLEPGEYAQAGAAVISVSGDGPLELEVEVPESIASSLVEGHEAQVSFPMLGISAVPARLTSVSRGVEGPGRLFPIVAEFASDSGLLPGMAGELVIRPSAGTRLAVPLTSIIDPSGKRPYVFRVRNGHAQRVEVAVRALVSDRVTVTAPLESGDRVVVAGHGVLLDGDLVKVR